MTRIIPVNSWMCFSETIAKNIYENKPYKRGRFIFRGQGSSDWKLVSSFDRWFQSFPGSKRDRDTVYKQLCQNLNRELRSEDIAESILSCELKSIALAQHHGLPTRLLDWSESHYIAAYFALSQGLDSGHKGDVAVWALDSEHASIKSIESLSIQRIVAEKNLRLRNQSGVFTHLVGEEEHIELALENRPNTEGLLRKFVLPMTEARRALSDLDAMNINPRSLFPGVEGSVRLVALRSFLELLY